MSYKIEQIEGVGSHFAERLGAVGVQTTDDLLSRCATPIGRQQVASATGLSPDRVLTWTNQADLMRVHGIGSEFAQLLEAAGVDSVRELAMRNPEHLARTLEKVNEQKHLTRVVPPVKTVGKWVAQARTMPAVVLH